MRRFLFTAILFIGALLGLILAGCRNQPLTLSAYAPSPSGIIFYSEREGLGALYYWDWQTHWIHRFTSPEEIISPYFFVDWSPIAKKLAYTCGHQSSMEICVRDLDGHRWQLTHNRWEDSQPRWSPDGQEIVFLSRRDSGTQRAYRMKADGSQQRPLFSDPNILSSWVVWSPDGQWLAVPSVLTYEQTGLGQSYPTHLYLIKASTGEIFHEFLDAVAATWSPNGEELAYVHRRGQDYEIYIYSLKEGRTRRLLSVSHLWYVEWSPDGQWLACVSGKLEPNYVDTRLFIIRPDGSGKRDLTPQGVLAILAGPGTWSPDSRYLLVDIQTQKLDVGIIDVITGDLLKVTNDEYFDEAHSWVWLASK